MNYKKLFPILASLSLITASLQAFNIDTTHDQHQAIEDDEVILLDHVDYAFDEEGRIIEVTFISNDGTSISETIEYDDADEELLKNPSIWNRFKTKVSSVKNALVAFKEKTSYTNHMEKTWDGVAEQFFHKAYLQFSGYYNHPSDSGCTPFGTEIHDKIRITFINGILNVRHDFDTLLKIFSDAHGGMPIHYVFRPTEGWSKDLLTSTLSKLGFASPYAKLLAQTWRDMIEEMGGMGQGGTIVHYAHSIGATDTYVAKGLLTPEERKMIHVITLGSPTMIPRDSGFASATNYVSRRDGVCLLDPIGYAMGHFYEKSTIELIGSSWGIPLIDHTLYTESYGGIIEQLGIQFINIYLKPNEHEIENNEIHAN